MSLDIMDNFLEHLEQDEKLAKEFFGSETPSEAIEIAKKAGYELTVNELKMILMKEVELSERDLDAVSGGLSTDGSCSMIDYERVEFLHNKLEDIMRRVSM